jgi:hypothetical protein
VEGCYFNNHSSYAIGVFEGYLSVSDCNFLDNIAGIHLDNVTADLRDCTMVGSWLFGLLADNSTVRWTVDGRCKIVSSDILGRVQFTMTGGDLRIEDCLVDLTSSSFFNVKGATAVVMIDVRWESDGAALSIASAGRVLLRECVFIGVGPIVGGSPGSFGVVLRDCDANVTDCRFLRARAGLSLVRCTATVVGTRIAECSSFGLFARDSTVDLQGTMVNRTVIGDGIHVEGSTLRASACAVVFAVNTLYATGSEVHMANCSMGGAEVSSVVVAQGHVTLVNTTHDQERVRASDNGSVDVWWYVSTRVLWSDLTDLVTSTVSVLDIEGVTVASGHPDASGTLPNLLVLSISHFPETLDLRGPLTVGVEHRGYQASTVVNLNSSIWVTLRLDDVDPPVFDIQSHTSLEIWVSDRALDIWGQAVDTGSGTKHVEAKLDYSPSPWMAMGSTFVFTITMTDGRHVIELMAVDNFGNEVRAVLVVHVETRSILLTPPDPGNGTVTNAASALVRGRLSRIEDVSVTVNRVPAQIDTANKSYSLLVDLEEGRNDITVLAEDVYGHRTTVSTMVIADWTPPQLTITSLLLVNTTEEWVAVTGSADADARVTIQGSSVLLRDGGFSVRYPVYLCETLLVIRAEDAVGNMREVEVLVFREDPDMEVEERSSWEVLPFILAIPILVVVEWYVLRPKDPIKSGGADG